MNWKIIDNNGVVVNTIFADESFVTEYCDKNGYIYERMPDSDPEPVPDPEPTQLDIIEAQVTYTAMMTDTLLEV